MGREVLRLLNTSSTQLNDSPPSTARNNISWCDASHALAHLPKHISDYARLTMSDGEHFDYKAFNNCFESALVMGVCLDLCKTISVDRYQNAVRWVLLECIKGNTNDCPFCKGTGIDHSHNSYTDCVECNGSGKIKVTDEMLAKGIGYCDGSEFRKRFKPVYLKLKQEILSNWDKQIEIALNRALK